MTTPASATTTPAPAPADGAALAPAAVRLGGELLRLGRYREAESVLRRALGTRDPRDRSTLLRSLLYLGEAARAAGQGDEAVEQYRQLLDHAQSLGRWDYVALAHAGMGLCLLERGELDEAEDQWAYARAAMGIRHDWFEDRELLEVFIARVQVQSGALELAEDRLARAAATLQGGDPYRWAQVQLERAVVRSQRDEIGARSLLEEVLGETASVESPPLRDRIGALQQLLGGPAVPMPEPLPS